MKDEQHISMENHNFKTTLGHPKTPQDQEAKLVDTSEDSTLGGRGKGEANLVLGCFFLDSCCLVDLHGPVCPCVDGVGEVTPHQELQSLISLEGKARSFELDRYSEIKQGEGRAILLAFF
ncbi:hypothetical protein M9H77_17293 [Catharanthus roseus]|uniref:Uncharacterized protein n=1 Tax=Catharanthus roseus TaxID=4058 RepID=A0ACC0B476_CATRO|nr:hypothetical protein M9H77_17293 [Catharanthus roseus]